jgi:hypothetical protein
MKVIRNYITITRTYTLWLFNIAMENGPFIDGLPILKMGGFSMAMLNNHNIYRHNIYLLVCPLSPLFHSLDLGFFYPSHPLTTLLPGDVVPSCSKPPKWGLDRLVKC